MSTSRAPLACPRIQMQTLTRMDKGFIEDYYRMANKGRDENMNWRKSTHLLSNISLYVRVPICTSAFTSRFLNVYVLERNYTSPLFILCTLMPQRIPLLTLTSGWMSRFSCFKEGFVILKFTSWNV